MTVAPEARAEGVAPEARPEGSQGRVRSEAEHAAPGSKERELSPERAKEIFGAFCSVGPLGLKSSSCDPGAARFALAPGYLLAAPPALHVTNK